MRLLSHEHGQTIVSALIGITIALMGLLWLQRSLDHTYRAERGVAANSALAELITSIRLLIDRKEACQMSGLIGIDVSSLLNGNNLPVEVRLKFPNGADFAAAGMTHEARRIQSLKLTSLQDHGGGWHLANLRLDTGITGRATTQRKPFHDFLINVVLDANKIVACAGKPDSPTESSLRTVSTMMGLVVNPSAAGHLVCEPVANHTTPVMGTWYSGCQFAYPLPIIEIDEPTQIAITFNGQINYDGGCTLLDPDNYKNATLAFLVSFDGGATFPAPGISSSGNSTSGYNLPTNGLLVTNTGAPASWGYMLHADEGDRLAFSMAAMLTHMPSTTPPAGCVTAFGVSGVFQVNFSKL